MLAPAAPGDGTWWTGRRPSRRDRSSPAPRVLLSRARVSSNGPSPPPLGFRVNRPKRQGERVKGLLLFPSSPACASDKPPGRHEGQGSCSHRRSPSAARLEEAGNEIAAGCGLAATSGAVCHGKGEAVPCGHPPAALWAGTRTAPLPSLVPGLCPAASPRGRVLPGRPATRPARQAMCARSRAGGKGGLSPPWGREGNQVPRAGTTSLLGVPGARPLAAGPSSTLCCALGGAPRPRRGSANREPLWVLRLSVRELPLPVAVATGTKDMVMG